MHNLSRRSDRRTDDWRLPAYSVEKLRQLSKQRADGSRELDSEEFSARNRNSCNLRENEIALTACSNHAGEFFNRIGQERTVSSSKCLLQIRRSFCGHCLCCQ